MTQDEAIQTVLAAVGTRHTTAHGYTDPYGAQCLAFIAWYTELLGYGPIMPGYNAIDVLTKNPLNLAKPSTPAPGDLFFLHAVFDGIDYGHTGVVVQVSSAGFYGVSQNWQHSSLTDGSDATKDYFPFSKIAGYLRPTFKEGEDMAQIEELTKLAEYRLQLLNEVGALVSVSGPIDGNSIEQVKANIKTQQARIDELTKMVGDLQAQSSGEYVAVPFTVYQKK